MTKLLILDNGGETLDRYTIINETDGEMIGASEHPQHPQGFGQYCGNVADNYWNVAYGYGWRNGCTPETIAKRVKFAVGRFKRDCANIGKSIKWDELPEKVKEYANWAFDETNAITI